MTRSKRENLSPFAKAVAQRDGWTATQIARQDPTVHELQLPTGSGYERALHAAVRLKSVGLARVLLDQGMDVDIPDSRGFTPLSLAPELYTRLSVVKLLVERGADIHFKNDFALWSAIWQASYRFVDRPSIAEFLVSRGSSPRGLFHAAEAGNFKVVKWVLALGADVNEVDENGHTPLDYCTGLAHTWLFKSGQNHPKLAKFLRDQGGVHGSGLKVER